MSSKDFLVVGYGHSLIYGRIANPLQIIRDDMAEYDLYAVLMVLCKISMTFSETDNSADQATQIKLIQGFFPLEVRKKILRVIRAGKSPRWALFSEQSLNNLVKVALEVAKVDTGREISSQEELETVGKWFLLMTDATLNIHDSSIELPVEVMLERIRLLVTQQHYLMENDRLAFQLCRSQIIFELAIKNKHGFNIEEIFEKALDDKVNFKEYFIIVFFLITRWSTTGSKRDINFDWLISKKLWFKNVKFPKQKINAVLNLLSFNPKYYKALYDEVVATIYKGKDEYLNNFLVFMKQPLIITSEENIVCPFPRFLVEKATSGVYWTIENYLLQTGNAKLRQKLPIVWGDAFEAYINERFANFGKNQFYPNPTINGAERADGILDLSKTVCFIESKAPHFTYAAKQLATKELLEPTLAQILGKNQKGKFKGLGQITQNIKELRAGKWQLPFDTKGKKLLPIIVVEEGMPLNEFTRKYYEDYAKKQGSFYEAFDVLPFIIIDAGEVETIEAIALGEGLDVVEKLLFDYSSMHLKRNQYGYCEFSTSFRNYLYSISHKVPDNNFMKQYFDNFSEEVRKYVKKDSELKTIT